MSDHRHRPDVVDADLARAAYASLTERLNNALDALADMADQYLSGPHGHLHMGAGEHATHILVKERPHEWHDDGLGALRHGAIR